MTILTDLRFALRSLSRVKGLALTVIVTLALGIGANAAIFSVVRGVLLRPLVNRDEARLIYIRQSAPGIGTDNTAFSVPEIQDLKDRVKSINAFGDFSTIGFTMVGLGEPRVVRAGVVGGSYFDVMGLKPVIGRLIGPKDDGPNAAGVAVLTYRFWTTDLGSDPTVLGKTLRLGERSATVIGVLEPSVPYPAETEIIANVVTSPHHLSATMVTGRVHRMTELFGRLADGATLDSAKGELRGIHAAMVKAHPEAYSPKADFRIDAVPLRDQITSPARTVLLILMAASGLIFVIACSNVANLILARSVRREGELAIRAALGAGTGALRRTLLAESLVLCGAGAIRRRPHRAADGRDPRALRVALLGSRARSDGRLQLLWVGVALATAAAVLLAFVPRLPSADATTGIGLLERRHGADHDGHQSPAAPVRRHADRRIVRPARRLGHAARDALRAAADQDRLRHGTGAGDRRAHRQLRAQAAGDRRLLQGSAAPHRGACLAWSARRLAPWCRGATRASSVRGSSSRCRATRAPTARKIRAAGSERSRPASSTRWACRSSPGRDFTEADRSDSEKVVIVSQSLARRMFPTQDALNHYFMWTDPVMQFIDISTGPRRIVGIAADIDDEDVVPGPAMSIYQPFDQEIGGGRLFVHTKTNPYALVSPITQIIRSLSAEQPVEKAATLQDIRAEVLAPDRLNALVFGVFAGVALLIAVVGVAGVLAFSVSARTREFGVRLAIGSAPKHLLMQRVDGRRRDRRRRDRRRRDRRLRACAARRQLHHRRAAARDAAARGRRRAADCGGGARLADARRARLARGRHPGVAIGVRTARLTNDE